MYWEKDWLGIVLPFFEEGDAQWLRDRVQYLACTTLPDRRTYPSRIVLFSHLSDCYDFIHAPEKDFNGLELEFRLKMVEVVKV